MHCLFSGIFFNFFQLSKVLIEIKGQTGVTCDKHGTSQLCQIKSNSKINKMLSYRRETALQGAL